MSATLLEEHLNRHGLELVRDQHKYRKLVAKKIIKKGTEVITSRPLCNPIIFPTHRSQHCETCFRTKGSSTHDKKGQKPVELERCSVCKRRYYCDRECFTIAWKGWHKWICPDKDMEDLDYEMLKMVVMSTERIRNGGAAATTAATTGDDTVDESLELTEYVFSTLMGHETVSDPTQLGKYGEIATHVRDQLIKSKFPFKSRNSSSGRSNIKSNSSGSPQDQQQEQQQQEQQQQEQQQVQQGPPSIEKMVQYLCRFHCNNFSIHDGQLFTLAEGTFPIGALFNHSCRPNAIVMYKDNNRIQVVRALEDILPGQEVCTSYVDNGVQRKERRQLLAEKYFFDCQCPRCVGVDDDEVVVEPAEDGTPVVEVTKKNPRSEYSGYRILDELIEGDQDGPNGDGKVTGEWLTKQFEMIVLPNARSFEKTVATDHVIIQGPSKAVTRASFTSYLVHSLVPLIMAETNNTLYQERLFGIYSHLQQQQLQQQQQTAFGQDDDPKPYTTTVMTHATSFFQTCLEDGQSWGLASKIGMFVLAQYLMIYPRHHPLIGLHCFTLAKSLWNDVEGGLASVRLSRAILELSRKILKVSHGNEDELLKEVEMFIKTVETELQ
ncbi:hypothetical protein BG004_000614 [Podila humilis]|nr:hypothetical protein BG004_000614 [Podila humilis]